MNPYVAPWITRTKAPVDAFTSVTDIPKFAPSAADVTATTPHDEEMTARHGERSGLIEAVVCS